METIKKLLITIALCASVNVFANPTHTDSQYRYAGQHIFISTQIPIDVTTGKLVSNDLDAQVKTVFDNLQRQVLDAGATMDDVVKLTVYMTDIDAAFPIVKSYIPQYFNSPYPARSPMGNIAFPKNSGFQIGIDAVVYIP